MIDINGDQFILQSKRKEKLLSGHDGAVRRTY